MQLFEFIEFLNFIKDNSVKLPVDLKHEDLVTLSKIYLSKKGYSENEIQTEYSIYNGQKRYLVDVVAIGKLGKEYAIECGQTEKTKIDFLNTVFLKVLHLPYNFTSIDNSSYLNLDGQKLLEFLKEKIEIYYLGTPTTEEKIAILTSERNYLMEVLGVIFKDYLYYRKEVEEYEFDEKEELSQFFYSKSRFRKNNILSDDFLAALKHLFGKDYDFKAIFNFPPFTNTLERKEKFLEFQAKVNTELKRPLRGL